MEPGEGPNGLGFGPNADPSVGVGTITQPGGNERHTVEAFERIKQLLADVEEDVKKAEGGNKAAGTRVRSIMQDVKNAAQEVRQKILEMRDAGKSQ